MSFNIGNQQAGIINNVDGNQTIHGGQTGSTDPVALLGRVRQEVAALPMNGDLAKQVHAELDTVGAALNTPQPDQRAAVSGLGRVVEKLKSAGVLATAGSGLVSSLSALVHSFGQLGEPVRRLLGF
jgi:hypothetical protein